MSLVGPRPERPFFVHSFSERVRSYGERHRVATGLTGWAQVNGLRGDTSIEERIAFDNYYIDNWSLWSDVKIMLRTITSFIRREPAESGARP
jgi:lipopolysaccharide/colanic/teichoic acid biosynthesis glycosyltransferase